MGYIFCTKIARILPTGISHHFSSKLPPTSVFAIKFQLYIINSAMFFEGTLLLTACKKFLIFDRDDGTNFDTDFVNSLNNRKMSCSLSRFSNFIRFCNWIVDSPKIFVFNMVSIKFWISGLWKSFDLLMIKFITCNSDMKKLSKFSWKDISIEPKKSHWALFSQTSSTTLHHLSEFKNPSKSLKYIRHSSAFRMPVYLLISTISKKS